MEWIKKHNIPFRLLAVLIAVLSWFFVVSEINPDMDSRFRNIDIQLTDIDQLTSNGLAIVSGGNENADIRVRGKRDRLGLLKADNFKLSASVSSISVPGTYNLSYAVDIDVSDVSVVSKSPAQITIVVDRVASKTVPASIKFSGQAPEGFSLAGYSLSPDAIVVKGPQSQLEKIEQALISFNLKSVNGPFETVLSYKLVDSKGNEINMDDITVDTPAVVFSADVKMKKTVPITVAYQSNGVFSNSIIKPTLTPSSVTIFGDVDEVKKINSINVGTVDIKSFLLSGQKTMEFDVVIPNGLESDIDLKTVLLSIDTPKHSLKKIVIGSSAFEALDGYTFLSGAGITVDVFGGNDILNGLTSQDFTVKTNHVKNDEDGVTATAALDVSCRFADVIIIGSYSAPVTIDEEVDPGVDTDAELPVTTLR